MCRYNSWSRWLRERWGTRVQKISLDSGAGCPNRKGLVSGGCIFCDARGGGSGAFLRGENLGSQIRRGFGRLDRVSGTTMALLYFQSYSPTNTTPEKFRETLESTLALSRNIGRVAGIAIGARPDQVPDDILDIMERLGEKNSIDVWLELGVQTIDPSGLKWLSRGHDLEEIEDAVARTAGRKIFVCAHLISGIPGERSLQLSHSSRWLAERGVQALKFHPLHVLRGTMLEKLYLESSFVPIIKEDYVSEVVHAIRVIPGDVLIQRLSADADPPELIAPDWLSRKAQVISLIQGRLEELGAFQGDMSTSSFGSQCNPEKPEPEGI